MSQNPIRKIFSMVPNAISFKHIKEPLDCYRLFDTQGNPVGAAVITTRVPPEIAGYRDEISILVGINESGVITGTKLLAHEETPEHMGQILKAGFLERFLNKKVSSDWNNIETITGATISSAAMKEDIHTASLAVLEKVINSGVLSDQSKKKPSASSVRMGRPKIAGAAIFLLAALSVAASYMPKRKILRLSSLFLSFVAIGLLFNTPVTISNFIDLGYGHIPGLNNPALLILLIFAVVVSTFQGPPLLRLSLPLRGDAGCGLRDEDSEMRLQRQVDEICRDASLARHLCSHHRGRRFQCRLIQKHGALRTLFRPRRRKRRVDPVRRDFDRCVFFEAAMVPHILSDRARHRNAFKTRHESAA